MTTKIIDVKVVDDKLIEGLLTPKTNTKEEVYGKSKSSIDITKLALDLHLMIQGERNKVRKQTEQKMIEHFKEVIDKMPRSIPIAYSDGSVSEKYYTDIDEQQRWSIKAFIFKKEVSN